jgi:pimeloyl-ACP methyl ester carboxylesterase
MNEERAPREGQRVVRRRAVFYVAGYDPRGPLWYHGIYRREGAKQAELSGMRFAVSRREKTSDDVVTWKVAAEAGGVETGGVETATDYHFLRWDDVVRQYWPRGPRLAWLTFGVVATFIRHGVLGRVLTTSWPTFICGVYPSSFVLALGIVALLAGLAIGFAVSWLAGWPGWSGWLIALALAAPATAYGTHVLDRKFSIHWLTRIYAFNIRQVNRQTPELDRRLDGWAERVAEAVRSGECDEILVVGHSTGAQAAVSLVARALKLAPDPGGCQLSLLTLGGSIPMLAWWPQSQWFREELERVATHPGLEWIDFTIAQDGACFALHDPVESSGIAHPQGAEPKPKLLSAKLFDLYSPESFDAVRRNWYKVHFQYLMAGERLGDYDYFAITAGPLTLSERYSHRPTTRDFDRFKLKMFGR